MEDFALDHNSHKFMNALLEDEAFFPSMDYSKIKNLLAKLGITGSSKLPDIKETAHVNNSIFDKVPNNVIEGIKNTFSTVKETDDKFKKCCSVASSMGVKMISSDVSFTDNQKINTGIDGLSHNHNSIIDDIKAFFNELSIQFESRKRMKESFDNVKNRVVATVNTVKSMISFCKGDIVEVIKTNINKGFTQIGVKLIDNYDVSLLGKGVKEEKPYTLSLERQNLEKLKALREQIMEQKLNQENEQTLEKGKSRVLSPFNQKGFTSHGSLIVFISILYTIIEFAMIIVKICIK